MEGENGRRELVVEDTRALHIAVFQFGGPGGAVVGPVVVGVGVMDPAVHPTVLETRDGKPGKGLAKVEHRHQNN